MQYKFYVKMDGEIFGPYSAKEIKDLELLDDILVTEASINEWLPAGYIDFDDMVKKELGVSINDDGTVSRTHYETPRNLERPGTHTPPSVQHQYTSTYIDEVPYEIKGWNWGAFFFSWIWGVCNGVYWPLLLIIINFIPYIGGLISLGATIVLGINGNEWAWKSKYWSSVAEFKRVQHNWAIAVVWVLGISIALGFVGGILIGIGGGL